MAKIKYIEIYHQQMFIYLIHVLLSLIWQIFILRPCIKFL